MRMTPRYRVTWDNGHDSGTFSDTFTSRRAAEQWARDWKRDMVAVEPTAADRRDARAAYQWDVIAIEPEPEPDDRDEQTLDYFNRYIAGDR